MSAAPLRLLFLPRETFPTTRVDVDVLFGREFCGRGHEIDFVMQAGTMDEAAGERTWYGRPVWVGHTDTRKGLLYRLRREWLGFRHDLRGLARLRRGRYDAVQVRDKFLIAAFALVAARLCGVRFCYWLSWPVPEAQALRARTGAARHPWLARLLGWASGFLLYRLILPHSDHVFVQSERMKANFCARGLEDRRITPVPMGVDLADIRDRAEAVPRSSDAVTVAYLGVLAAERHLEVLVDMLAFLRAGGMNARLLLIGDGPPLGRERIERRALELGLERHLHVTGFLPRPQALARAAATDVCLSPFFPTPVLMVASPTKLVEYLALGVPVVANDHPEQKLVLRECRAGVCTPWGARHFARGVRWLMARSPAERREMSGRGREWVRKHRTYQGIADDVERVYREITATPPGRRRAEVQP